MKKSNRFLLAGMLCSVSPIAANAQISIGPRVGINGAKVILDYESDDAFKTKMRLGPQVGVLLNADFGHVAIQPSVLYSQKGYIIDYILDINGYKTTFTGSAKLNYIEVPVNLVYTTGGKTGFQVFAGPYVEYGLSGGYQEERFFSGTSYYSYKRAGDVEFAAKTGIDRSKVYFRKVNVGANVGIGYKTEHLQAQLGYGFGLNNILPERLNSTDFDNKQYSRVLHLSLAYLFNLGSE